MVKRNLNFCKLQKGFLFPEITRRKEEFCQKHPLAELINLGIGDTTKPITPHVLKSLTCYTTSLGTEKGYSGYGCEHGLMELRTKISTNYYRGLVAPEEVLVSDGAGCDIGRLQTLFGSDVSVAIQDPAYPSYMDGSLIQGVQQIVKIPCLPENDFFPDIASYPRTDLIYLCSPNNPTGSALTRSQLKQLIDIAKVNKSIIIYDAAYALFISNPEIPKSIFEIEGAKDVAIELGSFSKSIGFTGVRLGWTALSKQLKFEDGSSVLADWKRLVATTFNGASNISQHGGLAALDQKGLEEAQNLVQYYLENAAILKTSFRELGFEVYGGENAPYLWVKFPGQSSWEAFQSLLENHQILSIPGSGFGISGEGFLRFSPFGPRKDIIEAMRRMKASLIASSNP